LTKDPPPKIEETHGLPPRTAELQKPLGIFFAKPVRTDQTNLYLFKNYFFEF